MPRSKEDAKALDDALGAIDGALQTLLMARTIILDRVESTAPKQDPLATMAARQKADKCEHQSTMDTQTMGTVVSFCMDCGEQVG